MIEVPDVAGLCLRAARKGVNLLPDRGSRRRSDERQSAQDVVDGNLLVVYARNRERLGSSTLLVAIRVPCRLPVDIDGARTQIHHPHLGNARVRVAWDLDTSVVGPSGVRDFDDKHHVGGSWKRIIVEVWPPPEEDNLRIELGPFAQDERVLDVDNRDRPTPFREHIGQAIDTRCMPAADWRQLHNLPVEEFQPIAPTQLKYRLFPTTKPASRKRSTNIVLV